MRVGCGTWRASRRDSFRDDCPRSRDEITCSCAPHESRDDTLVLERRFSSRESEERVNPRDGTLSDRGADVRRRRVARFLNFERSRADGTLNERMRRERERERGKPGKKRCAKFNVMYIRDERDTILDQSAPNEASDRCEVANNKRVFPSSTLNGG